MSSSSGPPALAPPLDVGSLPSSHDGQQRPIGHPAPTVATPTSKTHTNPFLPSSTIALVEDKSLTVTEAYARAVQDHAQHAGKDAKAPEISAVAKHLFEKHGHVEGALSNEGDEEGDDETAHKSKLSGLLSKLHLGGKASGPTSSSEIVGAQPSDSSQSDPSARSSALPDHHADQGHYHHAKKHGYDLVYPKGTELSPEDLQRTAQLGGWTTTPSELFLQAATHALAPLSSSPLAGLCSPSLLLSTATIPLSIVSTIPDIIHHHVSCIVRAKHEVFLATNFWEASGNAGKVVDGLKELSRRVIEGGRDKVVVKLMYDRGNPKQILKPHQLVPPSIYTAAKVLLPAPEDVPGISLEVVNYHDPPVGTFHAKYMVVDREVVVLCSSNIQDRVNVEMMTHIEGPIVQGFYDMALLSWSLAMHPPLPLLSQHLGAVPTSTQDSTKSLNAQQDGRANVPPITGENAGHPGWDDTNELEAKRQNEGMSTMEGVTKRLNTGTHLPANTTLDPATNPFTPVHLHAPHRPFPAMLVNRPPHGAPGHGSTFVPQDQAWLAALKYAKHKVVIQTPTFNAWPVVEGVIDAVRRGVTVEILADLGFNDEGELLPFQGGTNEMVSVEMYKRLESEELKSRLKFYWYTGKDQDRPVNATGKSRNCHVKLMIADGHVGIQGNGNMDVQSWFHSQEINIMVDSEEICADWQRMLLSNENTYQRGALSHDGLWRDATTGERLADKEDPAPPKGPMKSLQGVKGAIQRVRGEGGFAT